MLWWTNKEVLNFCKQIEHVSNFYIKQIFNYVFLLLPGLSVNSFLALYIVTDRTSETSSQKLRKPSLEYTSLYLQISSSNPESERQLSASKQSSLSEVSIS